MQLEIAGLVLLQPDRRWTLDTLSTLVSAPRSSVHRELRRFVDAGLMDADTSSRPHAYSAATEAPAYRPLKELLELTVGVPSRLARALRSIDGVDYATIHGSWAAGRIRADSDVDLLVVADQDGAAVRRAARDVGKGIRREVDVSVVSHAAFDRLREERNPFVSKILRGPRIDLVGRVEALADR